MINNKELQTACAECEGWTITVHASESHPHPRGEHPDLPFATLIPNYPVDANAAFTLVDSLEKEGWLIILTSDRGESGIRWECVFWNPNTDATHTATRPDRRIAICLAYLEVRGKLKEER